MKKFAFLATRFAALAFLSAVARARGTDLSSIINWALSLIHPKLVKERMEHEAQLLENAKTKVWEDAETPEERLGVLRQLLRKLEDEEDALAKKVRGKRVA